MRPGDVVTVALPGDDGKPRPALILQSDRFPDHPSVTLLPITSTLRDAPMVRMDLAPAPGNGLRMPSQIMVDKAVTVPRGRIGGVIGRLAEVELLAVTQALAVFLGFA
jgi:mRNA interferase MazF